MNSQNKNCLKENFQLDIDISNIFVAKNAKKRAFVEQFEYKSINFTQKDLGTIFGFFIVRDNSHTSENIVNFLSSEVKKKYFSPVVKTVDEKFELTLHRINRTLEEIANVGNIDWIGTIDSAICVINDTSITFSVTGNAHILLLRDNVLMDISEDLASKEAADYPLKTFIDISSGELCSDDKLIITSPELLEYVSFEELQKNAIHFGHANFIRFIQTVLTNECSMAATTVINIQQKELPAPQIQQSQRTESNNPINAFGATAFEKDIINTETIDINTDELLKDSETIIEDEWTDEKGHIHIQGTDEVIPEQTLLEKTQESLSDFTERTKEFLSKKSKKISKSITTLKANRANEHVQQKDSQEKEELVEDIDATLYDEKPPINESQDIAYAKKDLISDQYSNTKKALYKIYIITKNTTKSTILKCINVLTDFKKKVTADINQKPRQISTNAIETEEKSILPSFYHITNLWQKMNTQTKLISIGILMSIILIPLFFMMFSNRASENVIDNTQENTTTPEKLLEETSVEPISSNIIKDATILLEDSSVISTLLMKDTQLGISKQSITIFDGSQKENFPIPNDAGEIKLATNMDDLDLIFFLTNSNKLYSFSPVVKKFTQQKNVPSIDVSKTSTLGAFMTYLYITTDNQIKRFARQENGFADGENWLTKETDLSVTTSLAIDENIYTATKSSILKFSSHKKVPFSQDPAIQNAFLIYTTPNTSNTWILDKEQKTVFKTNKKTGTKIDEFVHDDFAQATALAVNEKNNTIIISTPDKILSFKI